jgi:hypothetical protein
LRIESGERLVALHYFHCTDGKNLVLDQTGWLTRSKNDVEPVACRVAAELMTSAAGPVDWSDWLVSVQDRNGSMVAVVPFPELDARRPDDVCR